MKSPTEICHTNRSGQSASAITREKVVDYSGTAEHMVPILEASSVQLRPGPELSNLTIFSSDKAYILGSHHHVESVGVVIIKPDYYAFMWWDGNQECRINGELARRTVLYAQGGQDGFHATGGARRTMGVAVRRSDLIETIAALRGVDPEDALLNRTALELSPTAATRFRASVKEIIGGVTRPSSPFKKSNEGLNRLGVKASE